MTTQTCNNTQCSCSTGIHEGLTFGSGRLDSHGYWEFPCDICARDWDDKLPETRENFKRENPSVNLENHEWLFWEGWPFENQDVEKLKTMWHESNDRRLAEDKELDGFFDD